MHHTGVFLVITASVAAAAKFSNTEFGTISAGSPIVLTWFDASSPVTIKLKNGASAALNDVSTIGTGLTGTSFSWTPTGSFSDGPYALEIIDSGAPNYSVQFEIGGSSSPSFVSSSASRTASSSISSKDSKPSSLSSESTDSVSATSTESLEMVSSSTAISVSETTSAEGAAPSSTRSSATQTSRTSSSSPTPINGDSNDSGAYESKKGFNFVTLSAMIFVIFASVM